MWKVNVHDDGAAELDCDLAPKCPTCGGRLTLWAMKGIHFNQTPYSGDMLGHALDVETVCDRCGMLNIFGLALSADEYERIDVQKFTGV